MSLLCCSLSRPFWLLRIPGIPTWVREDPPGLPQSQWPREQGRGCREATPSSLLPHPLHWKQGARPSAHAGKGLHLHLSGDLFESHCRGWLREDRDGTMATAGPGLSAQARGPDHPAQQLQKQEGTERGDRTCRALSDHLGPSLARQAAQPPGSGPPRVTLTRASPPVH